MKPTSSPWTQIPQNGRRFVRVFSSSGSNPARKKDFKAPEGSRKGSDGSGFQSRNSDEHKTQARDGPEDKNVYSRSFSRESDSSSTILANAARQGEAMQGPLVEDRRPRYREREAGKDRNGSLQRDNVTYEEKKKKPPKIREQVRILSPLNSNPHIAILGGGMSGLICALTLEERGIRSTVFDTGKHGLGGRMGTRHIAQVNGLPLVFDHAAQYFTVTDPTFQNLVNQWNSEGAVKEWNGIVGTLEKEGKFSELLPCSKYIATNGMRLLADHIVSKRQLIQVKRPCWISQMNEVNGMWHLFEYEKFQGAFDMVVIAHNGKCANRLLGPAGVPLIAKQMKRLELSSIWALLAAFEEPLSLSNSHNMKGQPEGAFVVGVDSLSWMGNNTKKLHPLQGHGPYCWTFFSTAAFGKKNKVPQESIPRPRAEKVIREMLQGVERALGLAEGSLPKPLYTKVQLWGAALPINTPHVPCIFDAYGRVGICGDWLLGSNLEAAALSGMAMANQISEYCNGKGLNPENFSIGLDKPFSTINGHDIGQFSVQESVRGVPIPELLTAA